MQLSHLILNATQEACLVLDRSSAVVFLNKEAEALFGQDKYAALGKYIWELFPDPPYSAGVAGIHDALYNRKSSKSQYFSAFFNSFVVLEAIAENSGAIIRIHKINDKPSSTDKPLTEQQGPGKDLPLPALKEIALLRQQLDAKRKELADAKDAVKSRDEFISIANHELKTPITSIQMYLESLLERYRQEKDDNVQQTLEAINKQVSRVAGMINHMLDVTKFDLHELPLQTTPFDLPELIQETIPMVPTDEKHRIILTGEATCPIVADKERLRQVIVNLLTNAIKYSPQADKVLIEVGKTASHVTISVKDYGIGIPRKNLSRIFQRFYRVKEDPDRRFPGLGIGLYITAKIVQAHHGRIRAESKRGDGSTFYVELPIRQGNQ